jgi:hypothetical protein
LSRNKLENMTYKNEPEELAEEAECLSYTLAKVFAQRGLAAEVAILADAKPVLQLNEYDNYDGGVWRYGLYLKISNSLFAQIEAEKQDTEERILGIARGLFRIELERHGLCEVRLCPRLDDIDPQWREKAKAWVSGKGMTNQGRVRSSNIASKTKDGLLFRSEPEILLYQALKKEGISFAPLPVFIRGGPSFQRMEPDFIIIKNGITLQVEVDGDTVHHETAAEAQTRVAMLEDEGVHVHRIAAGECDTVDKAQACAKKIVQKIANRRELK